MMDKRFDSNYIEKKWYKRWLESGAFASNNESPKEPYVIMMPPPNVTGSLHIGHALTFTIQDILIRFHRMQGLDVLWQPGTDHAGIATQMVVERELAKSNLTRYGLGREKFVENSDIRKSLLICTGLTVYLALILAYIWIPSSPFIYLGLGSVILHAVSIFGNRKIS